jgi:hypothetical protein
MVPKTFGCTNKGDKIYRVCIKNSRIIMNIDGSIIKDMKVTNIEPLGDFYNFMFTLSDNSKIRVGRNNEVVYVEETNDNNIFENVTLTGSFYSHDRKKLLSTVTSSLKESQKKIDKLKEEILKIADSCNSSVGIANSMAEFFKNETDNVTLEEFASMALN